ncbi:MULTISPECIES: KPN_02809 family neutral zinc metallopeptidase [Mycolicibacterium]|uniref:Predicted metalloprotease n=3 Tax=Mycolicibacterium gilvum TaxID=1804 RepID=E6TD38_MYCSR|nr:MULTISPECIES: neutral zinc metallopeptidase [Mycolicibacterium]ADT99746.1 predicted metalloprotease [Mycolicibacterium gilvum Spyr1]MBV5244006.1 neutral zinc metallopeptidase [Mycolicibacterium sp. PAM1]MCV7058307.1 neutral zinc metallopeptidase [Mycolicibacterium gilvum]STZ43312.1 metalloprotease [Mycolicibacterium gilvum]
MTFNEGMRIDTSTTSTSSGGRGPGRGIAVGGGLGGLLIVVVALFLGVDPSSVVPQQTDTQGVEAPGFDLSQCRTGADANEIVQCRVVATGNSLDGVWAQLMPDYTRPRVEIFTNGVQTEGCGPASSEVGPFYCPVDQTAYFDTGFFDVLKTQFGSSGGPFAEEYVVAHEFGHHVQNLQGVLGRAQQDPTGPTGGGVRTELQADCYAGVWAHYAAITKQEGTDVPFLEPLTDQQIADALSAAAAVGDDRIQETATGRVNPESWTHGSSEQRQKWFTTGYQTGDPARCDTFATNNLG